MPESKNTRLAPRRAAAPKKPKTKPAAKAAPVPEAKAATSTAATPDPPTMGALIDPMGHHPEALTQSEYSKLRAHLTIMRSDDHETLADLIEAATVIFGFEPSVPDEKALAWVVSSFMGNDDDRDGADGLLIPRGGLTITILENAGECERLQWTLAALRAGGWFAEWLALQVGTIADAKMACDRYPSPLKIMATLTEAVAEFEEQAETAREIVKRRPDLFPETKEAAHA
jgi:hypothetical protein